MHKRVSTLATNINKKTSLFRIIFGIIFGCATAILILNFAVIFILDTVVPAFFPQSTDAVYKFTRQLVTDLQTGNTEVVYEFLDDTTEGSLAMSDMAALVKEEAIINYEKLYICEIFIEEEMFDSFGVMYFKDTSIRFNIQLIPDAYKSWKVHRFVLLPEFGPGAFGNCE